MTIVAAATSAQRAVSQPGVRSGRRPVQDAAAILQCERSAQTASVLALLGVAVIWGFTYVIVKRAVATMPVSDFLTWRFALATLAVLVVRPRKPRMLGSRGDGDGRAWHAFPARSVPRRRGSADPWLRLHLRAPSCDAGQVGRLARSHGTGHRADGDRDGRVRLFRGARWAHCAAGSDLSWRGPCDRGSGDRRGLLRADLGTAPTERDEDRRDPHHGARLRRRGRRDRRWRAVGRPRQCGRSDRVGRQCFSASVGRRQGKACRRPASAQDVTATRPTGAERQQWRGASEKGNRSIVNQGGG